MSRPGLLVDLSRLELPTSRLSGVRSNHLSYRSMQLIGTIIFLIRNHKVISSWEVDVSTSQSLERRWSSRTFRYGYLVTTSPQLLTLPSTAAPYWLAHRLRVLPTSMVWRAVCTRPGNAFTVAFWSTITSNSNFMHSSCRVQSELGQAFWVLHQITL